MSIGERYGDVWVCTDCYFAHHYGTRYEAVPDASGETVMMWFVGESDRPCEAGEPLSKLDGFEVTDHTCSDHYYGQDPQEDDDGEFTEPCEQCGGTDREDGLIEFSWRACQGCGSHLGGARYRLALWKPQEAADVPSD
jgi:hypothetical protein